MVSDRQMGLVVDYDQRSIVHAYWTHGAGLQHVLISKPCALYSSYQEQYISFTGGQEVT